ncbi:unnamed protein product [Urochloa humidicola]
MRLARAILPLVRTTTTTATSSPAAVLRVGDALRERRRFTEADVAAYAAVSGDRNPVHLDAAAAARDVGGFQRGRVVHGMLVASVFPSVIAAHFPGAVYASQTLRFAAPVYVGDEMVARVQALHIRTIAANGSKTSRYAVKFATKCFMDEDEGSLAIDGEAMAILPTLDWSSETASQ